MLFEDTFRTIKKPGEGLFRDRGSRFLAYAVPVNADNDLKDVLGRLRAEHPKANHYCWAMRLTIDRSVFKLNDDGEPAGTAGRPILNMLLSRDITNAAVVVVRYFGGTLLGVPGLINAYKKATEDALNHTVIAEKTLIDLYIISFDYLQMNDIMRIIKEEEVTITEQESDNTCTLKIAIRKARVNQTMAKFNKLPSVMIKYDLSR